MSKHTFDTVCVLCDHGAFKQCRNNLKIECLTGKVTWSDCPIESSQMGEDASRSAADVWFRNMEDKNAFNEGNLRKDEDLCCELWPHSCHSQSPPTVGLIMTLTVCVLDQSNVGYWLSNTSLVCVTLKEWFHIRSVTCAVDLCFNDAHVCRFFSTCRRNPPARLILTQSTMNLYSPCP